MVERLESGACIGILGGGQLGRMLAVAASRLGFSAHIFDPSPDAPAAQVAARHSCASYNDLAALRDFAQSVDVITYEFENIPAQTLAFLSELRPIQPGVAALEISQDRLREKAFLNEIGLKTAPYMAVRSAQDLAAACAKIGLPAILKTTRLGYDGKGQVRLERLDDMRAAYETLRGAEAVLEGLVAFTCEISVIVARGMNGVVACYDPGENLHQGGILRTTQIPARISAAQRVDAALLAGRIVNALDYVGVMGVELFVTQDGLIVNEIAPRVHNSGHWTQQGCTVDQFEQHIRAVAGWPLGDGQRYADVVMENLIGDDIARVPQLSQESGVSIHLYGKKEASAGRKMGHINRVVARPAV